MKVGDLEISVQREPLLRLVVEGRPYGVYTDCTPRMLRDLARYLENEANKETQQ